MKIIHCADLHLDSKLESNLPKMKSDERRAELTLAFRRMTDFAVSNGVSAVIIAGDLFDSDCIRETTKEFVLGEIKRLPDITFLYLPGNHDRGSQLADEPDLPSNFKIFGKTWTSFEFQNVVITGVELTDDNCRNIYDSLRLDIDRFNIVTLHGQLGTECRADAVNRNLLSKKPIDYLALGHYHSFELGKMEKTTWCYCGCLEGRGFDEAGDKGFVLLDVAADNSFTYEFVKNSRRDIIRVECDVSGLEDTFDILKRIEESVKEISHDSMVKVTLKGDVTTNALKDTELFKKHLEDRFWFSKFSDETRLKLSADDYVNDISLKGEFIRRVMASDLPEALRDRVIQCGLAALSGREVL